MYVVDKIVRHLGKSGNLRVVVRWFRYTETDDTAKPPRHIPQQ